MNKEQAVSYLRFSGFSDEQIKAIEGAFSCPSAGVDCEDCPAYEKKSEWQKDHEILKAYSDGASAVLDKIRAEIQSVRGYYCYSSDAVIGSDAIIDDIEKILDKYIEEVKA